MIKAKTETGIETKKFIKDYFTAYTPLQLWENLRCALVHNYTISTNFALSSEPHPDLLSTDNISTNEFTVTEFIRELETAMTDLSVHLRDESNQIRRNALAKYNTSPIIIDVSRSSWQYDEPEADYLIKYYQTQLLGMPLNGHDDLLITSIIKRKIGSVFMIFCIAAKRDRNYEAKLDVVTEQLKIIYPIVALKEAGFSV